jgi:hypothetical protein
MASPYNDPSHWRARAIKTREIAKQITDPYDKKLLENVAAGYDRMAATTADKPQTEHAEPSWRTWR